jgi:hypothetical protein
MTGFLVVRLLPVHKTRFYVNSSSSTPFFVIRPVRIQILGYVKQNSVRISDFVYLSIQPCQRRCKFVHFDSTLCKCVHSLPQNLETRMQIRPFRLQICLSVFK